MSLARFFLDSACADAPTRLAPPFRLAANPAPPVAKDKRAPKWRPMGKAKPVFIPKWKQAKIDALPADKRAAALAAFKARWFPAPAKKA